MNAKGEAVVAVRRSVAVSARTHRGKGASSWRAGLRRPHKLPIGRATDAGEIGQCASHKGCFKYGKAYCVAFGEPKASALLNNYGEWSEDS